MFNWKPIFLDTFIPELPKLLNDNFVATKRYIDIFYDASRGVIVSPINTPGNIRGARVEGVTGVFDTLVVRRQFTNLLENTTTIDRDFYNSFVGDPIVGTLGDASLWQNPNFNYIDAISPYFKILNDASYAFASTQLGQEFQLLFDVSGGSDFTIMLDPSTNNGLVEILTITADDSSAAWFKLIAVDYDPSWGTTWTLKQFGGTFTRTEI